MTYLAVGLFVAFIAYALWEGTRSNSDNGSTRAGDSTAMSGSGSTGGHDGP